MTGPERVLVVLATWGPQPFTRAEVQHAVFDQTDAFYRSISYGKTWLTGTVTPWLHAFPGPISSCTVITIRDAATVAARDAGFRLGDYDRVVVVHPPAGCPWSGVTFANTVLINGILSRRVIAHELGHAFGLGHANATSCRRHAIGCDATEYGDPYDTMGSGFGDFSAYAKAQLGWITRIGRPAANGVYTLGPLEKQSRRAQALVLTTASDQYWLEDRTEPAVDDAGVVLARPGVTVHLNASPDIRGGPNSDFPHNLLIADPSGHKRPELLPGDRFRYPGAFTVTVLKPTADGARLRFRWIDRTPPKAPHVSATITDGRFRIVWDDAHETGSGISRYVVSIDGGAAARFGADLTQEPVMVGRALPGSHTVAVVAVDRAGNRSRPGVKRIETQ